jgi:hypothetical protein
LHVQNTTGANNVAVGAKALESNGTGGENVAIGGGAGAKSIGNKKVFIGNEAGAKEEGSNKLYIANSGTIEPLIFGNFEAKELRLFTSKLGFFGHAAVSRPAKPTTLEGVIKALEELGLVA